MSTMRYTQEHEWIRIEGDTGTIGISEYAQQQLGDIVYIELPEAGKEIAQSEQVAVVESVKAASEIYAPAGGTVTTVNDRLATEPGAVNEDATGEGWFVKLKLSDLGEIEGLMDEAAYKDYVAGLE
ncbi:MAG: glycine cleavage system protein GcvH [Alphaproteobacteria bacterium]